MSLRFALIMVLGLIVLTVPCFAQETATAGPFTEVETAVCASVVDRQPVGEAASFGSDVGQVFFWTKCMGAADTTAIQHVWVREGETMATVDLPVKSSAWRTWSSKQILPSWTGSWEVRVQDVDGNILKSVSFTIEAKAAVEKPAVEAEAEPAEEPEAEVKTDSM